MAEPTPDSQSVPAKAERLKVFVSYSRDDLDFADQLVAALQICGFEAAIDRHDIKGGEKWEQRLGALILWADTVVFVLSPNSARSSTCAWEVEEASRRGKRILPVLARALDGASPPPRLQDLNYVFFYPEPRARGSGFGTGLTELVTALNTDLSWIREHTRLLTRATEWDMDGRPRERLLSGGDIARAKEWAGRRPTGAPEPTALHLEFIRASEEREASEASAERKRVAEMAAAVEQSAKAVREREEAVQREAAAERKRARTNRVMTFFAFATAAVFLGLFVYALRQSQEADQQRANADARLHDAQITRSRALAAAARQQAEAGDWSTGILLALEALPDEEKARPLVLAARQRLSDGLKQLRERLTLEGEASLSADGALVLSRPSDKAPRLWDTATGKMRVLAGLDRPVRSAELSRDGKLALTAAEDQVPRLWDTATGHSRFTLDAAGQGAFASFSPDGTVVATRLSGRPPQLWSSADGTPLFLAGHPEEPVTQVLFSADSKLMLTLSERQAARPASEDHVARLWDVAARKQLAPLGGAELDIADAVFSTDSRVILTKSHNWDWRVWNATTGALARTIGAKRDRFDSRGFRTALSPDGKFVVTVQKDKPPRLWDTGSEAEPRALGRFPFDDAQFSSDSRHVLTWARGEAPRLWQTNADEPGVKLGDQATAGQLATLTPDGKSVLTVSSGGRISLWDTATHAEHELSKGDKPVSRALFTPDGRHLLTLSFDEMAAPDEVVATDRLATPEYVATGRLWSLEEGKERFTFAAYGHRPETIVFGSDGKSALTIDDETARLWDLTERASADADRSPPSLQQLTGRARDIVSRCLTIDQRERFLLPPKPPRWCIALAKYPYGTKVWQTSGAVDKALAGKFGNFADRAYRAADFASALEAAEEAIKYGPDLRWLRVNRAHALMFVGRVDEACVLHMDNRGKELELGGLWEEGVKADFTRLRDNDRRHPLMEKIEAMFQNPPDDCRTGIFRTLSRLIVR